MKTKVLIEILPNASLPPVWVYCGDKAMSETLLELLQYNLADYSSLLNHRGSDFILSRVSMDACIKLEDIVQIFLSVFGGELIELVNNSDRVMCEFTLESEKVKLEHLTDQARDQIEQLMADFERRGADVVGGGG